jgi:hypothetical protein
MYSREVREEFYKLLSAFMKSYKECQSMINDIYTNTGYTLRSTKEMQTLLKDFREPYFFKNFTTHFTILHDSFTQLYNIIKNDQVFNKYINKPNSILCFILNEIIKINKYFIQEQKNMKLRKTLEKSLMEG